jgi:hypothetical protein
MGPTVQSARPLPTYDPLRSALRRGLLLSLTSGLLRESPQVSVAVGAAEQLARIPHNSWDTVAWGRRGPTSRQLGSSAPAMTATGVTVPPLYSPLIHAPATRRVEPAFLAARSKIRGVQIRV